MTMVTASLLADRALRPYLDDVRQWHGYVRFLGLPTMVDNPDTPLSELFVTPALSDQKVAPEASTSTWPQAQSVLAQLAEHRRLVVLGDPGCGKSTIVNWLAWLLAGGADMALPDPLLGVLPLPLVARELKLDALSGFDSLLDAFFRQPVASALQSKRDAVLARLASGQALVLVDGLDEVPEHRRLQLRDALQEGARRYPHTLFLVSSRIVGYAACALEAPPEALRFSDDEFPDLPDLTLRRRSPEQSAITWATRYVMPFDDGRIASFAKQWYALRSIRHIAQQDTGQFLAAVHANPSIEALARLPQLLTLMALVYRVGTRLPDGRAVLYHQIAEAYLRSIDEARRLERVADDSSWEEKQRWLARIGFEMQLLRGQDDNNDGDGDRRELLAPRDAVLGWVRDAMQHSGYASRASDADLYLDWVARRSGLLLPRGEGYFAFVHLSFQEYFAALYLVDHLGDADWIMAQRESSTFADGDTRVTTGALRAWANSLAWQEVLVLTAECFANQPRDAKRLADWLFGPGLDDLAEAIKTIGLAKHGNERKILGQEAPRAELLTRLVLNPHTGWPSAERSRGKSLMFHYSDVVERVFSNNDFMGQLRVVTRRLLAHEPTSNEFWAWVAQRQPQELNLSTAGGVHLAQMPIWTGLVHLELDAVDEPGLLALAAIGLSLAALRIHDATALTSLEGLQACTNLVFLALPYSNITDLSPLRQSRQLKYIFLDHSQVKDISVLGDLTQLESLSLSGSPVADLEPLRQCQQLTTLFVDGCPAPSLAPLQNLPALRTLIVSRGTTLPSRLQSRVDAENLTVHYFV